MIPTARDPNSLGFGAVAHRRRHPQMPAIPPDPVYRPARYVYLAGPIAGHTFEASTGWRHKVQERLAKGVIGISPMRLKEWTKRYSQIPMDYADLEAASPVQFAVSGAPRAIASRDYFDVTNADMILAYQPAEAAPSLGTIVEIGWASAHQIPVVLATEKEEMVKHPLISSSVGWIVPDLNVAVEVVNSVLGAYTNG